MEAASVVLTTASQVVAIYKAIKEIKDAKKKNAPLWNVMNPALRDYSCYLQHTTLAASLPTTIHRARTLMGGRFTDGKLWLYAECERIDLGWSRSLVLYQSGTTFHNKDGVLTAD